MTDVNVNLKELINEAWKNSYQETIGADGFSATDKGKLHRDRGSTWVKCLGQGFAGYYSNKGQRVFWKGNKCNKREFGLQELLYDISVCQMEKVESLGKNKKRLQYVARALWQVESELNDSDSREITKDFSKLVMGDSDNKLFISSYQNSNENNNQDRAKEMCSKMARHCTRSLYLCFIPHPRDWNKSSESPLLYKWEKDHWCEIWLVNNCGLQESCKSLSRSNEIAGNVCPEGLGPELSDD